MPGARFPLGRAIARLLAAVLVAAAVALAGPGTAAAGGPTSVLLASPAAGAAAGLYYSDPDYERLQTLLGGPDLPAGSAPPPTTAGAPAVTATWLIHDVAAWRIDRIFLIDGDVRVVSEVAGADGSLTGDGMYPGQTGNATAVWHRPTDPAALITLLAAHGLTAGLVPGPGRAATDERPTAVATSGAPDAAAAAPSSGPGWPWAIVGLAAGVLIGSVLVRIRSGRRSPAPAGPAAPPERVRMQPVD